MSINQYSSELPEAHYSYHRSHYYAAMDSAASSSPPPAHHKPPLNWLYASATGPMFTFNLNAANETAAATDDEEYYSIDDKESNVNVVESAAVEEIEPTIPKQPLFEKPLTPSDVGKLNRLVIPKQHAEKCFPLNGGGESGLLLSFEDELGKPWRFRYSYWNSSQSYVLTKGWSRFVKEKHLDAGDIVVFSRHRSESGRLFIGWRRRNSIGGQDHANLAQPPVAVADSGSAWNRIPFTTNPHQIHRQLGQSNPPHLQQHAGSVAGAQNQTVSSAGGNSKRLRLFGVNLECQTAAEDSPVGSLVSTQSQYSNHYSYHHHHYYSSNSPHMDSTLSGGDTYRQG